MANKIVNAPIGKRALTAIFDLFFALLLGIGIYSLSSVWISSTPEGIANKEDMISYQINSHLYYKNNDGNVSFYDNLVSYDLYEERLVYYYTDFLKNGVPDQYKEDHDVYWYNVFILGLDDELHLYSQEQLSTIKNPSKNGKTIWEYRIENNQKTYQKPAIPVESLYNGSDRSKGLSETGKRVTLNFYYNPDQPNCYYNAADDLYHRPFYLSLVEAYEKRATVYPLILAVPTSALVFYLLFPLVFRDGQTLGKKIMRLAVIRQDGYSSTRPQILLRQLPAILMVTIVFIFMPFTIAAAISLGFLILSYVLAIFTKDNRAAHDYIAYTRVVDDKESLFHKKGEDVEAPIDPLFPSAQNDDAQNKPNDDSK